VSVQAMHTLGCWTVHAVSCSTVCLSCSSSWKRHLGRVGVAHNHTAVHYGTTTGLGLSGLEYIQCRVNTTLCYSSYIVIAWLCKPAVVHLKPQVAIN